MNKGMPPRGRFVNCMNSTQTSSTRAVADFHLEMIMSKFVKYQLKGTLTCFIYREIISYWVYLGNLYHWLIQPVWTGSGLCNVHWYCRLPCLIVVIGYWLLIRGKEEKLIFTGSPVNFPVGQLTWHGGCGCLRTRELRPAQYRWLCCFYLVVYFWYWLIHKLIDSVLMLCLDFI